MIVCGVEIKAKEAILAVVERTDDGWSHVNCSTKKLSLQNHQDAAELHNLKAAIEAFAQQNRIGCFAIKSRLATGVRAAGGITFKIEALFQLSGTPVAFVSHQAIAKTEKSNLGGLPSSVKKFQADACRAAITHAMKG